MKTISVHIMGIVLLCSSCGLIKDASITIDAERTKAPISKYIYGQFIEYLGCCIEGGIWAEMLEDRKFYFPITDEFKAWSTETADGPIAEMLSSPRRPYRTVAIFSSAEYFLLVLRLISRTTDSDFFSAISRLLC